MWLLTTSWLWRTCRNTLISPLRESVEFPLGEGIWYLSRCLNTGSLHLAESPPSEIRESLPCIPCIRALGGYTSLAALNHFLSWVFHNKLHLVLYWTCSRFSWVCRGLSPLAARVLTPAFLEAVGWKGDSFPKWDEVQQHEISAHFAGHCTIQDLWIVYFGNFPLSVFLERG